MTPVTAAIASELCVIIAIFTFAAFLANTGAILDTLAGWFR